MIVSEYENADWWSGGALMEVRSVPSMLLSAKAKPWNSATKQFVIDRSVGDIISRTIEIV